MPAFVPRFTVLLVCAASLMLAVLAVERAAAQSVLLRRPTLMVSDMDRALSFYRDILGFQLATPPRTIKGEDAYDIFNIPTGTEMRFAELDTSQGPGVVGLIQTPTMVPLDPDRQPRRTALVLNANGRFAQIMTDLRQGGYRVLKTHRIGAGTLEVGTFDPDGHLIVIFERQTP